MSKSGRIGWFGSSAALVLAGVVCAIAIGGGTGQVLALVLIGVGLVVAVSLAFLEVGLSEDRERARLETRASSVRAMRASRSRVKRLRDHGP